MNEFEKKFALKDNLEVAVKSVELNEFYRKNLEKSKFIAIQNSAFWKAVVSGIGLAKIYSALSYLVGRGDNQYDDYKGGYSFSFVLDVRKNEKISRYLYRIYHIRSYIEFCVFQIANLDDKRDSNTYSQPNNKLFSDDDICYFSRYFCDFLTVLAESIIEQERIKLNPFMRCSRSNLILFGYKDRQYFYDCYDTEEDFLKAYNALKKLECTEPFSKAEEKDEGRASQS